MQGRGEIVAMQQMIDSLQSSMRLLVASVRSLDDIVALASQARPQAGGIWDVIRDKTVLSSSSAWSSTCICICTHEDAIIESTREGRLWCAGMQHLHNFSRLRQSTIPGAADMAGRRSV